jgi:hypothetical protein
VPCDACYPAVAAAEFLNAFRTSCFVLMLVEACGMLLRARRTRQSTAAHPPAQSQSTNDQYNR